mmetsp:Transcript_26540/g.64141  ORF Transcript_26540/g.64141 Transcript_26540/m.64141 type:complete len:299 (+) Transcript_26540:534-1430(+)
MELRVQRGVPHADDGLVEPAPERLRAAVGRDVELPEGRAAGLQRRLAEDEGVAVVVDVGEGDQVLPLPENPQAAGPGGLEEVREHQRVPRAVDLVGRDRDGHQPRGVVHLAEVPLAHRLGPRVLRGEAPRRLALVRERQLLLPQADDVEAPRVEPRRGGGAHHDLLDPELLARLDHVHGPEVVHLLVEIVGIVRADDGRHVEDDVASFEGGHDVLELGQVALHVLDRLRLGCEVGAAPADVERGDVRRASLGEHLDQPLAYEAVPSCDARLHPGEVHPRALFVLPHGPAALRRVGVRV